MRNARCARRDDLLDLHAPPGPETGVESLEVTATQVVQAADLDIGVFHPGMTPGKLALASHGELLVGYIQVKNERMYLMAASLGDEADPGISVCLHVVFVDGACGCTQLEALQ